MLTPFSPLHGLEHAKHWFAMISTFATLLVYVICNIKLAALSKPQQIRFARFPISFRDELERKENLARKLHIASICKFVLPLAFVDRCEEIRMSK